MYLSFSNTNHIIINLSIAQGRSDDDSDDDIIGPRPPSSAVSITVKLLPFLNIHTTNLVINYQGVH